MGTARRITIYRRRDGDFGYRVQAGNWRTIETSEEGFLRKASILKRLDRRYRNAEIVDLTLP